MKVSFNPNDFNRIKGKLDKLNRVTKELNDPNNPIVKFKISILIVYKNAITRAMGSVQVVDYASDSHGGFNKGFHSDVAITLQGLGTEHTSWKNLTAGTIDYKRALGYRMKIWEASGDAKRGVRIHSEDGFVGLDSSDGEAFEHALRTEFGGVLNEGDTPQWEKRALFTVANSVVMSQKDVILKRIKDIILTYVSWGS